MKPTRIHHVNFVVYDLEKAMTHFESTLGVDAFEVVEHQSRGSRIATTQIGESRIVLVCPYVADSVPGRHLATHGEGVFLISFGYSDLSKHLQYLESRGIQVDDRKMRAGIDDWQVADIGEVNGVVLQMTQESALKPSD